MSDKYPLALPENTVLAGQYIIKEVLGQGGFGITYKAVDRISGKFVAVKEYFPESMATRLPGKTDVTSYSGDRGDNFQYGKQCFIQEAETLAQFIGNENIVRIYSYFEEYGTAYFVMDYIGGTSLDEYVKRNGGKISFEEAADILVPIMDALNAVHEKGIVHRDVSPDNIYLTNDGRVILIDFGAARQSLGDKSQSLDVILKHGFAPKEQYMRRGKQGPYTDIYALGATFYYVLTGKRPPDALERVDEDDIIPPSTLGVKLSKAAEEAILMSLNVQPTDRFQSMAAFKAAMLDVRSETNKITFFSASSVTSEPKSLESVNKQNHDSDTLGTKQAKESSKKKTVIIGATVLALICIAFVVVKLMTGSSGGITGNSLYPIIEGNNINNLVLGSKIDSSKEPGGVYIDPENSQYTYTCISFVDDKYYALNGSGNAVSFHVSGSDVINPVIIPELASYENISRLFVTKDYYFAYVNNQMISVSRADGSIKESKIWDLSSNEYTFSETGKFVYTDWDGSGSGIDMLYCLPAGSIDEVSEPYYAIQEYPSTGKRQVFSGGKDVIYFYQFGEWKGEDLNRLYRFDLSDSGKEPHILDLPSNSFYNFTSDGSNLFYKAYVLESEEDKEIWFRDLSLENVNYSIQIGILNADTGVESVLYETGNDCYGLTVYSDNNGKLSFFEGQVKATDPVITVP